MTKHNSNVSLQASESSAASKARRRGSRRPPRKLSRLNFRKTVRRCTEITESAALISGRRLSSPLPVFHPTTHVKSKRRHTRSIAAPRRAALTHPRPPCRTRPAPQPSVSERLSQLQRQLLQREGLLDQGGSGIQDAVVNDRVARIAGRVEHFQIGLSGQRDVRQHASVHFGHDDIGEEKRNVRPPDLNEFAMTPIRRSSAVLCRERPSRCG